MSRRIARRGTRRVSSAAWVPTDISGIQFWVKADTGITLNSTTVSGWADQSLTGDSNKNLAQGTAAAQPTYNSSDAGYNGQATLSFDSGDYMVSGTWSSSLAQPATHYLVGSTAVNGAADPLATDGIDASNRQSISGLIGTGKWTIYAGSAAVTVPTTTTVAKHVVCASFAGVSSAVYVDTYSAAEVSATPGTHSLTGVTVGARYSGSNQWAGKIAELIIYSGTHTEEQRRVVMQYLGTKYGITIT